MSSPLFRVSLPNGVMVEGASSDWSSVLVAAAKRLNSLEVANGQRKPLLAESLLESEETREARRENGDRISLA
jgi:hypothetical protein